GRHGEPGPFFPSDAVATLQKQRGRRVSGPEDALKVGVWRALGNQDAKDLFWPEGFFGLVVGVGGAAAVIHLSHVSARVSATGDVLFLAGAFLAVVFTALAIFISLPSNAYLKMLRETPDGGIRRFLDPYLIAAGTQVGVVLL